MKRPLLAIALLALPLAATAAGNPSHCAADEMQAFNCRIQNSEKILSLCASADLHTANSYLQYRFGKPGNIELHFPAQRAGSLQQFTYSHYLRYQVDYTSLSFRNGNTGYRVFDDYNGEDNQGEDNPGAENPEALAQSYGVETGDTTLFCAEPVTSELAQLQGIVRCADEDTSSDCR